MEPRGGSEPGPNWFFLGFFQPSVDLPLSGRHRHCCAQHITEDDSNVQPINAFIVQRVASESFFNLFKEDLKSF